MNDLLLQLGFSKKEIMIYLTLLEMGSQPAANVAKKINIPKSTVLFLCENLMEKGYIKRSIKGRTQFFSVDPNDLKNKKKLEIETQSKALKKLSPLLDEIKSPFSQVPKITFFTGINECKNAYQDLLNSQSEIKEFGVHQDLVEKFGEPFMKNFIAERVRKKLFLQSIIPNDKTSQALHKLDQKQLRDMNFFDSKHGEFYSSIAIYEDKVLLLNLHQDAFAVCIKNYEFSQTLKTIFTLLNKNL